MTETNKRYHSHSQGPTHGPSLGADPALTLLSAGTVAFAVILGGGARQGRWSDAVVELASLILIVVLVLRAGHYRWRDLDRFAVAIVVGVLALPLLQLIPLPPALWTVLPGRDSFAHAYNVAGMKLTWLPISLDPAATWRSWLSLLPAVGLFFATACLDHRARRRLSLLLIVLGVVSVLLGLAQLMQGPASGLRFYPFTNSSSSVGFFADSNHYATLLTLLIPVVAAWAVGIVYDQRANRFFALAICLILFSVLILGVGMAGSRAGVVLAMLATLASLFLVPIGDQGPARLALTVIAAAAAAGIILVIHFAFVRLVGRFDVDILADLRFTIALVTAAAVWHFFPVGTGFGTFAEVYRMFEPPSALLSAYVNHAHNELLEALLEGGILAGAVMLTFVVWFASRSLKAWRMLISPGRTLDRALARAATISLLLLVLFSLVEYPLRTAALSTIFAWLAGLLVAPLPLAAASRHAAADHADRATPWHRHHRRRRPNWARVRTLRTSLLPGR